jgi:preprotein translocase SecE subunit
VAKTGSAVANTRADNAPNFWERTKAFINEVRNEMRKVTTPNRKEVQSTTIVVIITVFLFAAFFFVVDQILSFGIDNLLKAAQR